MTEAELIQAIRSGGAVIEVEVKVKDKRWLGGVVIDAPELNESPFKRSDVIRKRLVELAESIDLEEK